jgi:hypothetical protein
VRALIVEDDDILAEFVATLAGLHCIRIVDLPRG